MKGAALVCTFGREALGELLACVARQTLALPVLVWVDNVPSLEVDAPGVEVVHGPRFESLGAVRRSAVAYAREEFELEPADALLVLDDDDFYSSHHFAVTMDALSGAEWTGGLELGSSVDNGEPVLLSGESGVGPHATWGYRLRHYDRAGGYDIHSVEGCGDVGLGFRMGWATSRAHRVCTHVRREHRANLSGSAVQFAREKQREIDRVASYIAPTWTEACERFESWCEAIPRPRLQG